jgi:cytochrome c553
VEEIQDSIEEELHHLGEFAVMKSFITYRFLHKMQRDHSLGLSAETTYVNSTQSVHEYIYQSDWRVNANANTGYSHAGLVNNLFKKCSACHGATGEKAALGKSKVIKEMTKGEITTALKGYKDGSYGGTSKGLMKGQVASLTDAQMTALANHIGK